MLPPEVRLDALCALPRYALESYSFSGRSALLFTQRKEHLLAKRPVKLNVNFSTTPVLFSVTEITNGVFWRSEVVDWAGLERQLGPLTHITVVETRGTRDIADDLLLDLLGNLARLRGKWKDASVMINDLPRLHRDQFLGLFSNCGLVFPQMKKDQSWPAYDLSISTFGTDATLYGNFVVSPGSYIW